MNKFNAMVKTAKKKKPKRKKIVLTEQQKEQNLQRKEIRDLMLNIGFSRFSKIDGKNFVYDGRTSELDDLFYLENILVIMEYTIGDPSSHLLNKKIFYDKVNSDKLKFIDFLLEGNAFSSLKTSFEENILNNYSKREIQLVIVYASKKKIGDEHRNLVQNVCYLDYSIVKYFQVISKIIKKSAKYEFFDFLKLDFDKIGESIKRSSLTPTEQFQGHILPEERSCFQAGFKIVTFYMDANALLKRAYVLRNDGWRNFGNVELYQRLLISKKIKAMRKYLHEQSRVFVNNIIVTLSSKHIKLYDKDKNLLTVDSSGCIKEADTKAQPALIEIENKPNIIGIIDGQHRSYAYHEGDDVYEETIQKLRTIQNLLVTGILYPENITTEARLRFEAKLFLEINATQQGASSSLKQTIENILNPNSSTAIAKHIITKLNESGPLLDKFEEHWYESDKIKTASIISFGLKPLIKFSGSDSLFKLWNNSQKEKLLEKEFNDQLLNEYKEFCVNEIRNLLIGFSANITKENWAISRKNSTAILSVTTINGLTNCLRFLIENNKTGDSNYYRKCFEKISGFNFKSFKSSQYRKMGESIYKECFIE